MSWRYGYGVLAGRNLPPRKRRPWPDSQNWNRGCEAWDQENLVEAFHCFLKGAEASEGQCFLNLGYCYDTGRGTKPNRARALFWYKRAYLHDDGAAAANIAILYREKCCSGLEFFWFRRSVQVEDGDSYVDLAKLYLRGKGVKRSIISAKKCLLLAGRSDFITEAGQEEAWRLLDLLS